MANSRNKKIPYSEWIKTPEFYISWSQLSMFEERPEEFRRSYIEGQDIGSTIYMDFGSRVARDFEIGISSDPGISHAMIFLPEFVKHEHEIVVPCEGIRLKAKLDGFDPKSKRIDELKTATKPWSQKRVDEHGQLTFYAYCVFLKHKKIPADIWLHWLETIRFGEEREMKVTGRVQSFQTKRIMADLIKMHARIMDAYAGIKQLCQKDEIRRNR